MLALELVKVLLENAGPQLRRSDRFLSAIRQYLCLSLLKNSAATLPAAHSLSCSIFLSLLTKFRTSLKAEVRVGAALWPWYVAMACHGMCTWYLDLHMASRHYILHALGCTCHLL